MIVYKLAQLPVPVTDEPSTLQQAKSELSSSRWICENFDLEISGAVQG